MPGGRLHAESGGDGDGSPVVLVHGFTQTLASWAPVAARLRRHHRVTAVDLPGHGGSAALRADLPGAATMVGEAGGRAVYAGYSMGGRVCLRLAVDAPELVSGLVLVGATPGIEDGQARDERVAQDEARARALERDGVGAFLDTWLAQPLFAGVGEERLGRQARLANTAEGLASALRGLGTGSQEPLWDRLKAFSMPVLLIAGERDQKFAGLARRMQAAIGANARLAIVPGAGHAVPLERPDVLASLVESLLDPGG